jgi:integrase
VRRFLTDWLDHALPASARSANTTANYSWAVEKHLLPTLGGHLLRDLRPDHVDELLRDLAAKGLSRSTLARVHGTLTRALRYAERRGIVHRNVSALVDTPDGPSTASRALTVEQAKALLAQLEGERLEALYVAGLMLGLRPGELLGLPWAAVDFDRAVLSVVQSLKREPGEHGQVLLIGEPKTPRSRRALDMPEPVAVALRAHRVRQAAEQLAAGPAWEDSGLVFTTRLGAPIDPANLRRDFRRLTKAAGLGPWHPNELRHSAASLLSAAGVPIESVSDVLGHEGPRVTAAVYRHAITPSTAAARAPMDGMFGATS